MGYRYLHLNLNLILLARCLELLSRQNKSSIPRSNTMYDYNTIIAKCVLNKLLDAYDTIEIKYKFSERKRDILMIFRLIVFFSFLSV